jgi:hypothetical protein
VGLLIVRSAVFMGLHHVLCGNSTMEAHMCYSIGIRDGLLRQSFEATSEGKLGYQ